MNIQRLLFLLFFILCSISNLLAQEEGIASYYHGKFHGKKMSSGRTHDKEELVAAHRKLPFGTYVRVTNLSNMKYVIVCIEDRGPFRKGWIIDVSETAAKRLDFIRKGITKVRIEIVPGPENPAYLKFLYPTSLPLLDIKIIKSLPEKIPFRYELPKKTSKGYK